MKILAFGASSSRNSINKMLAAYAASLIEGATVNVVDLNDFELPLFSVDKEQEIGHPEAAKSFLQHISESDALIISYAEHNGSYSAAFKNLFDWSSRIEKKLFQGKPMVLLATSPGGRGAASVLQAAVNSAPHFDGVVKANLSIPNFHENFDAESQALTNPELKQRLLDAVSTLA